MSDGDSNSRSAAEMRRLIEEYTAEGGSLEDLGLRERDAQVVPPVPPAPPVPQPPAPPAPAPAPPAQPAPAQVSSTKPLQKSPPRFCGEPSKFDACKNKFMDFATHNNFVD